MLEIINFKNRKNERIRALEVRVIGHDGKQVGVLSTKEAIEMAKNLGLDLVEVSPTARPPVCRIVDFGKFMYEQSKKGKDASKSSAATKLKEIKFRLNIETHDYETKLRHAEEFLDRGNRVKVTLSLRGREMDQKERAFEVMKRAIADLEGMSTHDGDLKLVGRNIGIMLTPLPVHRRKPRFIELGGPHTTKDDSNEEEE